MSPYKEKTDNDFLKDFAKQIKGWDEGWKDIYTDKVTKEKPSKYYEDTLGKAPNTLNFFSCKIHDFDKPVFIANTKEKVFSIKGCTIVSKDPVISMGKNKIFIIDDDEICYMIEKKQSSYSIYVTCGKKFGKREVETLVSILLKLDTDGIKVYLQKYNRKKSCLDPSNSCWY
jgi:hypothetical protein